jgi:type I restriction enzyme S subunit
MKTDWQTSTLGDLLEVLRNGVNCKQTKNGEGEKISRIESISAGRFDIERVGYTLLEERDKARFRLRRGDILFSHINSPIHVGKTALFDCSEPVYHGVNLLLMRPKAQIAAVYLEYMLKYLFQRGYWLDVCKQSVNQASVNQQDISKVEIHYPKSVAEQRRIVAILDEAFAGLEAMRANAEKNLQNARDLFDSYLNVIFTQKGEGWVEKKFGDICENLDSRRIPITKKDRAEGNIPYYGASGIVDYVEKHIFDEDILLVSEDGANLLARTYPIAFSVAGKCWVNNHAHVVRFPKKATQHFVELYLNAIPLDPYVSGMAQPKLNQKSLNSIPIPLPSLLEQERIVSNATELSTETQRLESIYRQKLAAITELRQSILQKAFSGQLTSAETIAA